MKYVYIFFFVVLNKIFIPYRLKRCESFFRIIKNSIAKKLFANIGKNAVIRPNVKLSYLNHISLGNNSSIGDRSLIVAAEKVNIGNDVLMGPEIMIFTQNHEIPPLGIKLIDGGIVKKKVCIEDNVWIGARTIILPGAIIQQGTVIAAGSVVPGKTYPPNVVLGGNPAKIIRKRD
ncbi:acyltransferase [Enterococcus lactis]|uniref:acyltransferase n=1 Tax=Enterococcus lactis TaxID=357441 RepID=UPI004042DB39